jgi:hypothetical protein
MLAPDNIFQAGLPQGFEYLDEEQVFDATIHLQLERPERVWTLEELGYCPHAIENFPSPVAITSPVRLLSDEGVKALRMVIDGLMTYRVDRMINRDIPSFLRGTVFRSRFMRDLCTSRDVADLMSEVFGVPLMPHTLPNCLGQVNLSPPDLGTPVDRWHWDVTAFDYVMMVHDPHELQGGYFEYFAGNRVEAQELMEACGRLPQERIVRPDFPGPGYAVLHQGAAIFHHATELTKPGFRAGVINSFACRDVSKPDTNRTRFVEGFSDVDIRRKYQEWARHKALLSSTKLLTVVKSLPFNEERKVILERLRDGIADVQQAIELIEQGVVSFETAAEQRAALDALMTPHPPHRCPDKLAQSA